MEKIIFICKKRYLYGGYRHSEELTFGCPIPPKPTIHGKEGGIDQQKQPHHYHPPIPSHPPYEKHEHKEHGEYEEHDHRKEFTSHEQPNICSGLFNSASFVANYLRTQGYDAKVKNADDGNDIDRLVTEFNPKFVILEALWVTPEKINELLSIRRHQKRIWIIRLHSKFTFLANEGIAFKWLLGYKKLADKFHNLYVATNVEETTNDIHKAFGLPTIYLPNVYHPHSIPQLPQTYKDKNIINIGCFGAIRPMKNTLIQAIAAIEFADNLDLKLHFHVNAGRTELNGENILKNLQWLFRGQKEHKLIEHPWLDYNDFVHLVRKMDMGMQVSLSETFNIVSADFVSNDIPLIGSKEISWLPDVFCANASSTKDIVDHLWFAWTEPGYALRKVSLERLKSHNINAEHHWNYLLSHY